MTKTTQFLTVLKPSLRRAMLFLVCFLAAMPGQAQTLIVNDSRGSMTADTLTVGFDLWAGIQGGLPNTDYRLILEDEVGAQVAALDITTDGQGDAPLVQLWNRSGVWGCEQELGPPWTPGDYAYGSIGEASQDLDGRIFDLKLYTVNPSNLVVGKVIPLEAPRQAIYYWSDRGGDAKCVFESDERIYLSVYKGYLEDFTDSRVFMVHAPVNKIDWSVWMEFVDVRVKPDCNNLFEVCGYPTGTLSETVPSTVTAELEGMAPFQGKFLALIRDANGSTEKTRLLCDRSVESVLVRGQADWDIELADNEDGWGCPPCPP